MTVVTRDFMTQCQGARSPAAHRTGLAKRVADLVRLWRARRRERQTFSCLGHRELRDIGLSRWEVEQELAKPFWRG